jgi:hypothetical protein
MEDKRAIKRERSPSAEGSLLPDDAETPPSTPSGSPPQPGSPSEVSSRRPCSPVFEQGNASKKTLMIDPSSFIVDTSRDEELVRKLFSDLNRDILDDSDYDNEAQDEKTIGTQSTTAPASADDAPAEAKISNSDD